MKDKPMGSKELVFSILSNDNRIPNGVYCREYNNNALYPVIHFRKPKHITVGEYKAAIKVLKDIFYA